MRQRYRRFRFKPETLELIDKINSVIDEYVNEGFKLTVRQLYYQLVARDYIPNNERSYKQITGVINDARLAGVMDWDMIEDRTRAFERRNHWDNPGQILNAVASQYHQDLWERQPTRAFVIIEKEALASVFEGVCHEMDVPMLAARGYPSVSVLREFAVNDIIPAAQNGQDVLLLHFGDHDPSGIDMTRDLLERLELFTDDFMEGQTLSLERIALNMDQVRKYKPPPNPAKTTDARFANYQAEHGNKSWELDALSPSVLADLVRSNLEPYIDQERWDAVLDEINNHKTTLRKLAAKYN